MARQNLKPTIFIALISLADASLGLASTIDTILGSQTTIGPIQTSKAAISFLTGSSGPYQLTDLKFDLFNGGEGANSYTFNVDLYDAGDLPGYFPTGTSLAQTILSTGNMANGASAVLDYTTLDALGSYSLAANTAYALVLSGAIPGVAGGSLAWNAGGSGVVTDNGFSLLQGFNFNNGSWFTPTNDPLRFSMQVSENSTIPEPASLSLLGLGLALVALAKPRKADKT